MVKENINLLSFAILGILSLTRSLHSTVFHNVGGGQTDIHPHTHTDFAIYSTGWGQCHHFSGRVKTQKNSFYLGGKNSNPKVIQIQNKINWNTSDSLDLFIYYIYCSIGIGLTNDVPAQKGKFKYTMFIYFSNCILIKS